MKMSKIRGFIASCFAVALIIVLGGALAGMAGKRLPVLSIVSDAMGFTQPPG